MKYAIVALALALTGCVTQTSDGNGQPEPAISPAAQKCPVNLLPEQSNKIARYEAAAKDPEIRFTELADKLLKEVAFLRHAAKYGLDTTTDVGEARHIGTNQAVKLGWRYFLERNDPETALKRFNQAWYLNPRNPEAYHGMGVTISYMYSKGMHPECNYSFEMAYDVLLKSITIPGHTALTQVDLAETALHMGRYKIAEDHARRALAKNPKVKRARIHMATAKLFNNQRKQACDWAQKARDHGDRVPGKFLSVACGDDPLPENILEAIKRSKRS